MKVYHRTHQAAAILAEGFRDAEGYYLTNQLWRGVWVADRPLDENEGAAGDEVLTLEVPQELLAEYEWVQEGGCYREFLVPADLLNQYGPPRVDESQCPTI